jgi:hypothetical protein
VKERNSLRNSLGNLLPLSSARNSSFQNICFEEKKAKSENRLGYKYGCYSEIEVSEKKAWTALEILERGLALLSFMEERWQLSLGTIQDKAKILSLDFLSSHYPEAFTQAVKAGTYSRRRTLKK